MADPQVTLDIGGAVSASLSVITAVQGLLTGGRSATIEIDNNTGLKLKWLASHPIHGGFAKFPEPEINPMSAMVFGAQNKGSALTGTDGWVLYYAEDSQLLLSVVWDNPYVGANKGYARLSSNKADQYMVRFLVGAGNTLAPFRFILLPNPGPAYSQIKDVTDGGFL
jgi:hypothetical protein